MSSPRTFFVVNPTAGQGRAAKLWLDVRSQIEKKITKFAVGLTNGPGDATRLTSQALKDGYEFIVACGGDGTVNECLNGFFKNDEPRSKKAVFGILPLGRGSDLARGLGLKLDQTAAYLMGQKIRVLDIGKATFKGLDGKQSSRYFINIANVGFVPVVVEKARFSPKILGAKISYLYGTARGILSYTPPHISYENHEGKIEERVLNLIIANGRYFGSGMCPAPEAEFDDGAFDVISVPWKGVSSLAKLLPHLYFGRYPASSHVRSFRQARLEISTPDASQPVLIEMDGDFVGFPPARFEILPRAIQFKL